MARTTRNAKAFHGTRAGAGGIAAHRIKSVGANGGGLGRVQSLEGAGVDGSSQECRRGASDVHIPYERGGRNPLSANVMMDGTSAALPKRGRESDSPNSRRMEMRLSAAIMTLALAASSASASQLDLQPGDTAGPAQYRDFNAKGSLLESNGPIRRRRAYRDPDRYDYGRRYQPEYWAMLGGGTFDPTDQPGHGLYLNGGMGTTLAKQIDLGVQISWYHHSTAGEQLVREYDLPDG